MADTSHGGNIWAYESARRGLLLDFSANINPLGMPSSVKKCISETLDLVPHYPMPHSEEIKEQLAVTHGIDASNVLVGNGSIELVYLIMKALVQHKALIPTPTFSEYEYAARAHGVRCSFVDAKEHNGFKVSIDALCKALPTVECLFFCNPNNPTGVVYSQHDLLRLATECKKHKVYLVVDEAFIDFLDDGEKTSVIIESTRNKYLLVLRSLTKIFALAGLRLGYLVGHKQVINKLKAMQYPWNVNVLAQKVGAVVINERAFIDKTRALIMKERKYMATRLRQLPNITVFSSSANFVLCKIKKSLSLNAQSLSDKMAKRNILIRNCANFRGLHNRFFRLAIRTRKENMKLISTLREEIAECPIGV